MTGILLLSRAYAFAAERHVDQRRRGVRAEPYINHLAEVAALVSEATEGKDPNLAAAAILHDTIEDTSTTYAELVEFFNADVADLVAEVTDNKSLPKQTRKDLQVENAPRKSPRAQMIKIADKLSNLRSLASSPPAHWPEQRRREYLVWARQVVNGARGANPWLEQAFDKAADELEARLQNAVAG